MILCFCKVPVFITTFSRHWEYGGALRTISYSSVFFDDKLFRNEGGAQKVQAGRHHSSECWRTKVELNSYVRTNSYVLLKVSAKVRY